VATVVALALGAGAVALAVKAPKHKAPQVVSGLPDPPTKVTAKQLGPDHIQVAWGLVRNVPTYQVITIAGGKNVAAGTVQKPTQVFDAKGLTPNTRYCFVVRSMLDAAHVSAASRLICKKTAALASTGGSSGAPSSGASSGAPSSGGGSSGAASSGAASSGAPSSGAPSSPTSSGSSGSSGSPTTSGSATGGPPPFGPNDYVVLVGQFRGKNAKSHAIAEEFKVSQQGFTPDGVLFTRPYPSMTILGHPVVHPFWAAYAGPVDENTARSLQTSCVNVTGDSCVVAKPGPHK
jgi:hypothetical protein